MTICKATVIEVALVAVALACPAGFHCRPALAGMAEPWDCSYRHPVTADVRTRGKNAHRRYAGQAAPAPLSFAAVLWKELLTKIDGPRCMHRPSCSAYAVQSISRYGIIQGLFLTLARLWRGADSSALRRLPACGGKFCDPPSASEFRRDGYLPIPGFRK